MNSGAFNLRDMLSKPKIQAILSNPKQRDLLLAAIVTVGWFFLILVIWLATKGLEDRWEFGVFLGRFHILALHLPVSFLLGVLAVEVFAFVPVLRPYSQGSLVMLWFALFGTVATTILGFLLMVGDHITGHFMTLHLWTGLGVVVFTAAILVMKMLEVRPSVLIGALVANLALTSYSSHEGGNMVHGEEYLGRYAPTAIAPFLGYVPKTAPKMAEKLEDRIIYEHLLQPIFDGKCVECHTSGKVEGKLRMDCFAELAKGGKAGAEWVSGKPDESELYARVTMDRDDDEFMPPKGKAEPMTEAEIAVMAWWIERGASPKMTVGEAKPDAEMLNRLKEVAAAQAKGSKKKTETGGQK